MKASRTGLPQRARDITQSERVVRVNLCREMFLLDQQRVRALLC